MSTYEEAITAREKFKEQYWKQAPDKYNVIAVQVDIDIDPDKEEIVFEDYYVVAYLFDIANATELPPTIDNVQIKYFPVVDT